MGTLLRAGREDRLWERLGQLSFLCLDAWPLHTVGREGPLWVPRGEKDGIQCLHESRFYWRKVGRGRLLNPTADRDKLGAMD